MSARQNPELQKLARALHQALRGNTRANEQIEALFIFRKSGLLETARLDPKSALTVFLKLCLNEVQASHPEQAKLLARRFLEKEPIKSIARSLSLSEEQVNRQQRAAIEGLAEWVQRRESQERQEFELSLTNRLPPSSYTRLIGVENKLSKLTGLLAAGKPPWVLAVVGPGGIGKSAWADRAIRSLITRFPYQHLFWLRFDGEVQIKKQDLATLLARNLLQEAVPFSQHLTELRRHLKSQPFLIVLDNLDRELDDPDWIEFLHHLANPSKFVLTGRKFPAPLAQVYTLEIEELEFQSARELLVYEAKQRGLQSIAGDLRQHMQEIYAHSGGNPLALRLIAGLLQAWSLPTVLQALQESTAGDVEELYNNLYDKNWASLSPAARRLLKTLQFAGAAGAGELQLQVVSNLVPRTFHKALFDLRQHSLLELRGTLYERRYGIHNLTESFLRAKTRDKPVASKKTFRHDAESNLAFWSHQLNHENGIQILKAEKRNLEKAIEIGLSVDCKLGVYDVLNKLAPAILELRQAQDWITYFQHGIAILGNKEKKQRISLQYQLGTLYWQTAENEKALKLFTKSYESAQRGMSQQKVKAQLAICLSLWSGRLFSYAWQEAQFAEAELKSLKKDDPLKTRGLAILGVIAFAVKKYEKASTFFLAALERRYPTKNRFKPS